ncbi:MAG: N-acetylmuramoyl-L-alanine amidase [uncultured bacterium (gcode 4)]|uniref:N-acetylmuramoyl-L-alanine amidase n=1 Tax=uncultured bacterium (gcode 4) TaxID=1234023 RepID=K1YXJ2_9BACT|nr:MAG: N-acetylmuramoyl-L-alanine amidase [uncultured bacterium (gcode 4)]
MKKYVFLTLVALLFPIFSPIGGSFHIEKKYSYASEEQVQHLKFKNIPEPTASIDGTKSLSFWKRSTGAVRFSSSENMFILKIPKTFDIKAGNNPLRVNLSVDGKIFPLSIDSDGDGRDEAFYYTEPLFLDKTEQVSYVIETRSDIQIPAVSVIGLDTDANNLRVAFGSNLAEAAVGTANPNIIKRAGWGADESLRYEDSPRWQAIFAKLEANKDKPKSDKTLANELKNQTIATHLATNFPEQDRAIERIESENGHPLAWPIQKTKQVERIIVHHTAENNQNNKDDLGLIRGIYYYHTIVRGWGDIGYNYLVGQRGQIYEGRAGGDYNVSAHALWNNKSSVGVSVMGNFMTDAVVAEQENAIKQIVEYLSKKYGIDLHKTSIGHKECSKNDCFINDFAVPNLTGHREVGFTSCPGGNLFAVVENIRKTETASIGRSLVINPNYDSIKIASITPPQSLNKWPTVRIRLSYTGSVIRLKSGDNTLPRLTIGVNSWILKKNLELPFEASGTDKIALVVGKKKYPFSKVELSANLIEIPSWNRKPSWDTSGLMNDNIFRGKISLLNEWGKLVVVNELPLEDYLRGIAEVSNGDNEEKIKTILTAARSYAYFYSYPENRKFPGKTYDGSDNPDEFQKYLGYGYEKRSPMSSRLVDITNGQIITYGGVPIKPWYFSESSGQTLSAKQYCENRVQNGTLGKSTVCKDIPYLQSVTDPGGVGHTQKWHGVGISGIGATYLAKDMGFTYDQIIAYYLDGVKVEKKY